MEPIKLHLSLLIAFYIKQYIDELNLSAKRDDDIKNAISFQSENRFTLRTLEGIYRFDIWPDGTKNISDFQNEEANRFFYIIFAGSKYEFNNEKFEEIEKNNDKTTFLVIKKTKYFITKRTAALNERLFYRISELMPLILHLYNNSNHNRSNQSKQEIYAIPESLKQFKEYIYRFYTFTCEKAFVLGAGVSKEYGVLDWSKMLDTLSTISMTVNKKIYRVIGNDQYTKAEVAKSSPRYFNKIYGCLYHSLSVLPYPTTLSIVGDYILRNNKTDVITFNYDDYLEKYLTKHSLKPNCFNTIYTSDYLKNIDTCCDIYHVHGFMPEIYKISSNYLKKEFEDSIVLTEGDYFKLYSDFSNWNVATQLYFYKDKVCLFIGNSITDTYEKQMLNLSLNKYKFNFLFKCEPSLNTAEKLIVEKYYFKYGIIVIWLDKWANIKKYL